MQTPYHSSDIATQATGVVWNAAINFLRKMAKAENFQAMSGPDALTECANAMEMALTVPNVIQDN